MKSNSAEMNAVLSIGRIYCDLIFTGLETMPVLGREVFASNMAITGGGGAFIVAAYLAHTGRTTALLARLGTDSLSVGLLDQLATSGIDLRFLEQAPDAGPQVSVAINHSHERAFLSRRAGSAQPAALLPALAWEKATHLHIAEYATLAEIPDLVRNAKAHGLTVSLDPSWDETLIFDPAFIGNCMGVDIFLPNEEEASLRASRSLTRPVPVMHSMQDSSMPGSTGWIRNPASMPVLLWEVWLSRLPAAPQHSGRPWMWPASHHSCGLSEPAFREMPWHIMSQDKWPPGFRFYLIGCVNSSPNGEGATQKGYLS